MFGQRKTIGFANDKSRNWKLTDHNFGVSWTPDYQMKDWYGRKQIIRVYNDTIRNERVVNLVGWN